MPSIPQRKPALGEISAQANEMNHRSPPRKCLIPRGSGRKTNIIPDNKASIQKQRKRCENLLSRLEAVAEKHSTPGLQVAVRVRPLNSSETHRGKVWKALSKFSSITQTTRDGEPLVKSERVTGKTFFTYDKSFGETTSTDTVYESVAKGIVNSVVSGVNGTIFAYGQTSSGKTYTMQGAGSIADGAKPGSGGIIHMAAKDIFRQIAMTRDRNFEVKTSFLEIYNEEVRDLLSDDKRTLSIRENSQKGVFVECTEEIVLDAKGLFDIIHRGEQARMVASTAMNERSSRSHTIIRITVESTSRFEEKENSSTGLEYDTIRRSTLNLVDLAGSESVRLTGATAGRQKEGGMINQSLLALSRVVSALGSSNQSFVNFRDSKLTRILQSTLSGNSKISFICCITPSEGCMEETRSTLQFASRAKRVKVHAEVNEVVNDSATIERLQRQLTSVQQELQKNATDTHQKLTEALLESEKAQSDAKRAQQKNDKILKLIAASEHFFGNSNRAPNQRRLSEADMLRTPSSNKSLIELSEPKSEFRVYKQSATTKDAEKSLLEERLALITFETKVLQEDKKEIEAELIQKKKDLKQMTDELSQSDEQQRRFRYTLFRAGFERDQLLHRQQQRHNSTHLEQRYSVVVEHDSNFVREDELCETQQRMVEDQVVALKESETFLKNELLKHKSELERVMLQNSSLNEALSSSTSELKEATLQKDHLIEEKNQKTQNYDKLMSDYRDASMSFAKAEDALATVKGELDVYKSRCKLLEMDIEESRALEKDLRKSIEDKSNKLDDLESKVADLEDSERFLKVEMSKQKSELEGVLSQNSCLEEALSSLTSELNILQEATLQKDHLMEEMNQKTQNYEKLMSDYRDASMSLVKAEEAVAAFKGELDVYKSRCKLLELDIEESRAIEKDLRKSIDDKSNRLDDIEHRLTSIQNKVKEKDKQLKNALSTNASLKESLTLSNDTIADMERKIADAEARLEFQETSLYQMCNIEEELRAELDLKNIQYQKLLSKCTTAECLQSKIMAKASVRKSSGNVICTFDQSKVTFLTPRCRYAIELYDRFLRLRGEYGYKIKYDDIDGIFLLPKPDKVHMAFVIALVKPFRHGEQSYKYLLIHAPKDQDEVTVELDEETLEKEYNGELQPVMRGSLSNLIAKTFNVISGKEIFIPDTFTSSNAKACINCAVGANEGLLYPLEKQFVFIHEPPILIRFNEIESVEFQRCAGGKGSTRNFDLCVNLKGTDQSTKGYTFSGIDWSDYAGLYNFLSGKQIPIQKNDDLDSALEDHLESDAPKRKKTVRRSCAKVNYYEPKGGKRIKKDPDAPKRALSAYMFFAKSNRNKLKSKKPHLSFGELGKELGAQWRALSASDKAKYDAMASKDKDRYQSAMKNYFPADTGYRAPKSTKKKKDPNAPKRSMTSFMLFSDEQRAKLKKEQPSLTFGEVGKKLGEMFRALSASEKAKYEEMARKDKERYKKAVLLYNSLVEQGIERGSDDDSDDLLEDHWQQRTARKQPFIRIPPEADVSSSASSSDDSDDSDNEEDPWQQQRTPPKTDVSSE